jgi:hypothetical protein
MRLQVCVQQLLHGEQRMVAVQTYTHVCVL